MHSAEGAQELLVARTTFYWSTCTLQRRRLPAFLNAAGTFQRGRNAYTNAAAQVPPEMFFGRAQDQFSVQPNRNELGLRRPSIGEDRPAERGPTPSSPAGTRYHRRANRFEAWGAPRLDPTPRRHLVNHRRSPPTLRRRPAGDSERTNYRQGGLHRWAQTRSTHERSSYFWTRRISF